MSSPSTRQRSFMRFCWTIGIALVVVAAVAWAPIAPRGVTTSAEAAETPTAVVDAPPALKIDSAVQMVPDDVAFFVDMLRMREQFDILRASRVWKRIEELPFTQMGLSLYRLQALNEESVPGQIEHALHDPDQRKLIDFSADLISHEIFICGDDQTADLLDVGLEVVSKLRVAPLKFLIANAEGVAGEEDGEEGHDPIRDMRRMDQFQQREFLQALADHADELKAPNLLVGFRVSDRDRAREMLAKLEPLVQMALAQAPPEFAERLTHETIGDAEFLVLSLDGSMIPWDEVTQELDVPSLLDAEDADALLHAAREATLEIAVGLRGDYVLVSVGSSLDLLKRLGEGPALATRPELLRLAPHAAGRVVALDYVSANLRQAADTTRHDLDAWAELAQFFAEHGGERADLAERLGIDAVALRNDFEQELPLPAAAADIAFLSDAGVESFYYDWTAAPQLDASQPLTLLNHLGGHPLFAAVGRTQRSEVQEERVRYWLQQAWGYFNDFALPAIESPHREQIEQFIAAATPIVEEIDHVNRESLAPGLADGQIALTVDTQLLSRQFHAQQPPSEEPLPMIEPALLLGVSDAALTRKALESHRQSLDKLLSAAREAFGADAIPPAVQLPKAKGVDVELGRLWIYSLPKEAELDAQIAPTVALSQQVLALTTTREQAERLMQEKPLAVGGVLADLQRPRAAAVAVDVHELVDALRPWAEYVLAQAEAQKGPDAGTNQIRPHVMAVLDVLKALRSLTAETYREHDTMVTHTLLEVHDIE